MWSYRRCSLTDSAADGVAGPHAGHEPASRCPDCCYASVTPHRTTRHEIAQSRTVLVTHLSASLHLTYGQPTQELSRTQHKYADVRANVN